MRHYPCTIADALRAAQKERMWNQTRMAIALGMSRNHYSEVLSLQRRLPYEAACRAFVMGVPAKVLLSLVNITICQKSPPGEST